MSKIYSPRIVTDSLVMCLDPSQNKSYPTINLPIKSDLGLWLDASDDTTFSYSSGTAVSQWRDKSGNNFHASQGTVASQPSRSTTQNSRKTVNFDGVNDTVTIPNFSCNSEMSIFVVSNCGTSLLIEHSTDANSNQGFYFYGGGNGMIYITRSTGTLIFNTNWLSGGYSIASAVNSTGLDLLTYKNGTQQTIITDSRSTVINSYVTTTLYIGSRGANSLWSSGPIAEIIIYNRKVTNAERNLIHTYLGQKWGISNTDRSIIDLSGNDDNGLLGNGTTANMPVYSYYNKGTFKFDGSNDYINCGNANALNFGSGDFSVEMWFTRDSNATTNLRLLSKGADSDVSGSAGFAFFGSDSGINFAINPSGARTIISAASYSVGEWVHVVAVVQRGSTMRTYKNAVLTNSATAPAGSVSSASNNLNIGRSSESSSLYWAGNIAMVRIYNKALSVAEITQNYEAQKSKFANTIVQQGLLLNLDAGNPYSYAGAGTTWFDVSGNGYNGTLTNGPTFNNSTGGNIVFDGTDDYTTTNLDLSWNNTNSVSISMWIKTGNLSQSKGFLGTGNYEWQFRQGQYNGANSDLVFVYWDNSGGHTNGSIPSMTGFFDNTDWKHLVMTWNNSNSTMTFYKNSVSIYSLVYGNPSVNRVTSELLQIGGNVFSWDGLGAYWNGSFSNISIYNRALTAVEVLQNYNATKGRFGL